MQSAFSYARQDAHQGKASPSRLSPVRVMALLAVAVAWPMVPRAHSQGKRPNRTTPAASSGRPVLRGQQALGDWTTDAPGVRRHITTADLPPPFATRSVDNGPHGVVPRPAGAWPRVPPGFKSVGSHSNNSDDAAEHHRADVLEYNPDGSGFRIYASGIRNAVGIAIHPETGELWGSVNERDELGDNLVPDYITRLRSGGFYGWPWFYIGPHWDPRHQGKHPELRDRVLVPDVLLESHMASLQMTFYTGRQFPITPSYKDIK